MSETAPTVTVNIVSRWNSDRVLFGAEVDASIPLIGRVKVALQIAVSRGADLCGADLRDANLCGANLCGANLCGANLRDADLCDANLCGANLCGANLCGADLRDANLCGADLRGADLRDAKGATIERTSPLAMLRYQPGVIRAFKALTSDGQGHIQGGLTYARDALAEVADADTGEHELCGSGIHLATLDWCLREWRPGLTISAFDFTSADIAAIPLGTDGKFRVFRATRREDIPQAEIDRMLGKTATQTEDAA